jgi:DNA repair protein RecN (Recombination protein N)
MLIELRVRDLGVIEDISLVLGPGMTALTGETGAGKTLVVEALELLLGGRPDPTLVRSGADEAFVEGRFVTESSGPESSGPESGGPESDGPRHDGPRHDGPEQHRAEHEQETETILTRSLPATGRSRAWVDGGMATQGVLAEAGRRLVDLHGQHAHQSLLEAAHQRAALDGFAGVETAALAAARALVRDLDSEIKELGGDERERAREADLLRYQVEEIRVASISGPEEDEELQAEQARLSDATGLREAARDAVGELDAEQSGVLDTLGRAVAHLEGREPFAELQDRARGIQADTSDLVSDLRKVTETWDDDPQRLAEVSQRRALMAELRRKYGADLGEVMRYGEEAELRLLELESTGERLGKLMDQRDQAAIDLQKVEARVSKQRRKAAPKLASAVEANLRTLAMPAATVEVSVGTESAGDEVRFLLSANPGESVQPLSKVASGGELARAMLALRLVVAGGRPTLVFDEVDAGIGGAAAEAVGRALGSLARRYQVLVVTHLPQVAAFAESQFVVEKSVQKGRTRAVVRRVEGEERTEEMARMLSGRPASESGRRHAKELLEEAEQSRAQFRTGS